MIFKPHDYQRYCIERILEEKYLGLLLKMGLGKTVIVLTAVKELIERGETKRVLVIAPKRVAESTWPAEIDKWDHLRGFTYETCLGPVKARLKAIERDAEITIINRENVPWLVENFGKAWRWDTVIIDELSSFKNSQAKRFRALKRVRPQISRIYGLTGTPSPNGYIDLWAEVFLLDGGRALERTKTKFLRKYFVETTKYGSGGHTYKDYRIKDRAPEVIERRLEPFCISLKAEDYIDLPDMLTETIEVKLSPEEYKDYKRMERDNIIELVDEDITAVNAGVVTNKLLQIASGRVYDDSGKPVKIHDAKLETLAEVIESAAGEPILLFYNFKHELESITRRFKEARVLEVDEDINAWNRGEIPLLLAHPASAGYGLNMQGGGHIVLWYSPTWNLEQYQQANARLHRQGQEEPVRVIHLVASGTIDEKVLEVLERKDERQEALIEALKVIRDESIN